MKKLTALLLVIVLAVSLCTVASMADDESVAIVLVPEDETLLTAEDLALFFVDRDAIEEEIETSVSWYKETTKDGKSERELVEEMPLVIKITAIGPRIYVADGYMPSLKLVDLVAAYAPEKDPDSEHEYRWHRIFNQNCRWRGLRYGACKDCYGIEFDLARGNHSYKDGVCTVCGKVLTPAVTPKPTAKPTAAPTPTIKPTTAPTPTVKPTTAPTPTVKPTTAPTPTVKPTTAPTPTVKPTTAPTPTVKPTTAPTPTTVPTAEPTVAPTAEPTVAPTEDPTPTTVPTEDPCNHKFGSYHDNSDDHYRVCSVCDHVEYSEHREKSEINKETHHVYCELCNHQFTPYGEHSFGPWEYLNLEDHIRKCSECGYEENGQHHVTCSSKNDEYHEFRCAECGKSVEDLHEFGDIYEKDGKHYKKCDICNAEIYWGDKPQ